MAYKKNFLVYGQTFKGSGIKHKAKRVLQEKSFFECDRAKGHKPEDISEYDFMECDNIYFAYDAYSEEYKIGLIIAKDKHNNDRRGGDGSREIFDFYIPTQSELDEIMATERYIGDNLISLNDLFFEMGLDVSKFTLGSCSYYY